MWLGIWYETAGSHLKTFAFPQKVIVGFETSLLKTLHM